MNRKSNWKTITVIGVKNEVFDLDSIGVLLHKFERKHQSRFNDHRIILGEKVCFQNSDKSNQFTKNLKLSPTHDQPPQNHFESSTKNNMPQKEGLTKEGYERIDQNESNDTNTYSDDFNFDFNFDF